MTSHRDKAVGIVGLVLSGLAAYAFLAVAGRALGPAGFAPIGTMWAVVFLATAALAAPLELVVSRTVATTRARAQPPGGPAAAGLALAALAALPLAVAAALAGGGLDEALFGGQPGFSLLAAAALGGLLLGAVAKGLCTGTDRLAGWGAYLVSDAAVRLLLSGVAWLVAPTPAAFAVSIAVGPWIAAVPLWAWLRRRVVAIGFTAPPRSAVARMARHAAPLVVAASAAAAMTYLGPVLLSLGAPTPSPRLGATIGALSLARVPLFALSPLVALVVPRVAFAAERGDAATAVRAAAVLTGSAIAGGVAIAAAAAVSGGGLVEAAFGSGFSVPSASLDAIAAAAAGWLVATAATAIPIALREGRLAVTAWSAGLAVALGAAAWLGPDPYARVDVALVLGAAAAAGLGLLGAVAALRGVLPRSAAPEVPA